MKDSGDMRLLLDSRVPLIVIETYDEKRALDMLLRVANQRKKNIFRWSVTDGLTRLSFGPEVAIAKYTEPREVLEHIKQTSTAGIYVLCDFHHYLEGEPRNVRLIKDIAQLHHNVPNTVVFLSHHLELPADISRYGAVVQLALPSEEEILAIIREEAKLWSERQIESRVKTDTTSLQALVANLRGLSHSEVRRLARGAIVDDGAITESDIPAVSKAKFELTDMKGVLSFDYNTERFSCVGGLTRLKKWLTERRAAFRSEDTGDVPKGIMLTGVQGSGKSLAAKSVAGL